MRRVVLTLLLLGWATGCVHHPGLPAPTTSAYEAKAASTATAAISAVSTVRLALDSEAMDHTTTRYLGVTVSDQEDRLEGVVSSFSAIAPPTESARSLREDLLAALDPAVDHVASARIAIDAGDLDAAVKLRPALAHDAEQLSGFES